MSLEVVSRNVANRDIRTVRNTHQVEGHRQKRGGCKKWMILRDFRFQEEKQKTYVTLVQSRRS